MSTQKALKFSTEIESETRIWQI